MENDDSVKGIAWPVNIDSMVARESTTALPTGEQKRRKYRRCCGLCWCPCSLCCLASLLFLTLILLTALAALLISLLGIGKKTTTIASTTIRTITTTANITVTSAPTTIITTITSAPTTIITSSTSSIPTTTIYCGQSCLNQSWIDPSGILASWSFDGSFADSTGAYNGYIFSNPPTFVTGYVGQAASFNASDHEALYTSHIPLSNRSFTAEAWIKTTGYPHTNDYSIVGLCPEMIINECLHLNVRAERLYLGFYYDDIQGGTPVLLNQWIHAGFVFDITTMTQTIYINGFQDAQGIASNILNVAAGNFTIGINEGVNFPESYFQGYIDQLSINARPKSSCEILERATLAAYFKFDTPSPYSDSGPNAVASTSSTTTIITGYRNQAISFTGTSSSYFQTSGFTSLGISNQAFSITLWIRPRVLSGTLVHLSSSLLGTGSTCFPLLGFASNGAIIAQVLTSSDTIATATGPVLPISSSSWIPIVQTWSATNGLKLYVNNTLVSSVGAATFLGSEITPNYLILGGCLSGCSVCSSGLVGTAGPFQGAIDDWRIYSREISSVDVCALYFGV